MPRLAVLVLVILACAEPRAKQPAVEAVAPQPPPSDPTPAQVLTIDVTDDDRTCSSDADCTAILTQCSMCEGACTGVRTDRADRYTVLDCSDHRGKVCNYDCRPSFGIEAPRCVTGRCESVRLR